MTAMKINLHPDNKHLKTFGFIALGFFLLLSGLVRSGLDVFGADFGSGRISASYFFAGLGLLSGLFSLFWPPGNRPLFVGLTVLTFPIGLLVSFLVMLILYFALVTPIAILFQLMGRDRLRLKRSGNATSYWHPCNDKDKSPSRYFRQF